MDLQRADMNELETIIADMREMAEQTSVIGVVSDGVDDSKNYLEESTEGEALISTLSVVQTMLNEAADSLEAKIYT